MRFATFAFSGAAGRLAGSSFFLRREIDELTSWIIFGFVRLPFPSFRRSITFLNSIVFACACAPSVRTLSAPNEMIALGARAVIHQGVGPLDASLQQNASECMHGRMKLETILEGALVVSYFLPLHETSCLRSAFKLFIHLPPTKSKAEINLLSFPDAPTSTLQ